MTRNDSERLGSKIRPVRLGVRLGYRIPGEALDPSASKAPGLVTNFNKVICLRLLRVYPPGVQVMGVATAAWVTVTERQVPDALSESWWRLAWRRALGFDY